LLKEKEKKKLGGRETGVTAKAVAGARRCCLGPIFYERTTHFKRHCPLHPSCPPRTLLNFVFPSLSLPPILSALLNSSVSISNHPSTHPLRPAQASQMNIARAQVTLIETRGPAVVASPSTRWNKPTSWTALPVLVHLTLYHPVHPTTLLPTTATPRPWRQQRAIHRGQRQSQLFLLPL